MLTRPWAQPKPLRNPHTIKLLLTFEKKTPAWQDLGSEPAMPWTNQYFQINNRNSKQRNLQKSLHSKLSTRNYESVRI